MKGLTRFEEFAAWLIEGVFRRLPGRRLEPVEIAQRLAREMEDHQTIGAGKIFVPNRYRVTLHPETFQAFISYKRALEEELAAYLSEEARREGFAFIGRPHITLEPDPRVRPGTVAVAGQMADSPLLTGEEAEATQALGVEDIQGAARIPGQPAYQLVIGERTIPLGREPIALGRSLDNDVILQEPTVSRRHAQIIHRHGRLVLRDLASTYGTFVNGQRIEECVLQPGDVIRLGGVDLQLEPMPTENSDTPQPS